MNYSEEYVFIVYIVVIICLIGLIVLVKYFNIGDFLHSYKGKGTIAAYYGIKPPKGWILCDGKNGTPDLRGRFVYGGNILSQQLYKNGYNSNSEKYFVDYTEQITGGSNYQTLTNRVGNLDTYINVVPSANTNILVIDTVDDNKNMNHSLSYKQNFLDTITSNIVEDVDTHGSETNKLNRIGNLDNIEDVLSDDQKTQIDALDENNDANITKIITEVDIKNAEIASTKTRVDNVSEELTYLSTTDAKYNPDNIKQELEDAKTKPDEYAQILKTQEELIKDAEIEVLVIEGPDYEGYKYPSNKNLNADLNLPPYYALIYIMKL